MATTYYKGLRLKRELRKKDGGILEGIYVLSILRS
jgi:hypothetical protein